MERRTFLRNTLGVGLVAIGAGCADKDAASSIDNAADQELAVTCDDTSGLSEDDISNRSKLGYVDLSAKQGQYCNNCSFWVEGESPRSCGTCTVVKGPVAPKGYCITWAARQS